MSWKTLEEFKGVVASAILLKCGYVCQRELLTSSDIMSTLVSFPQIVVKVFFVLYVPCTFLSLS